MKMAQRVILTLVGFSILGSSAVALDTPESRAEDAKKLIDRLAKQYSSLVDERKASTDRAFVKALSEGTWKHALDTAGDGPCQLLKGVGESPADKEKITDPKELSNARFSRGIGVKSFSIISPMKVDGRPVFSNAFGEFKNRPLKDPMLKGS